MCDLSYKYGFRIILVGDSTVGKSTLSRKFVDPFSDESVGLTIGVDFFAKIIPIGNRQTQIKLQIWDTAGQEKFRSIIKSYYRNTVGVLLVYDITNRESFLNLSDWLLDVKNNLDNRNAVYIIVGTKSDLSKYRQVKEEEARQFANSHNLLFKETSAKLNYNVQEVFRLVAEQIYEKIESGEFKIDEYKPAISCFNLNNDNNYKLYSRQNSSNETKNHCKC